MNAARAQPPVNPQWSIAYRICDAFFRNRGCLCERRGAEPCPNATLAACAAEKAIEQRERVG
jgi:hypothetical protein